MKTLPDSKTPSFARVVKEFLTVSVTVILLQLLAISLLGLSLAVWVIPVGLAVIVVTAASGVHLIMKSP